MIKNADQITIVITLRADSSERARNIDILLRYLHFTGIHVMLLEADKENLYTGWTAYGNVDFTFIHDENPMFHRTRYTNILLRQCSTPFVAVWDVDIILPYEQLEKTLAILITGNHVMAFPYNLTTMLLSNEQTLNCINIVSITECLQANISNYRKALSRPSYGGVFMVSREAYLQCGGENEHFISWGPEDSERAHRMMILGCPIYINDEGPQFHLWHPVGRNSYFFNKEIANKNRAEFVKVCNMEKDELEKYIKAEM